MRGWQTSLLSLSSGLLFACALPPLGLWFLAWLWMAPLLAVLWWIRPQEGRRTLWSGFCHGWLAGAGAFGTSLYWIGHVTVPGVIAMCAYLALFPAVWGFCAVLLRPRGPWHGQLAALALALLWAGLEWLRGLLLTGFPWNGAAAPLIEMPGFRAAAQSIGVMGLSVAPVFFQTGFASAWKSWKRDRATLPFFAAWSVPVFMSLLGWEKRSAGMVTQDVLLLQPNVAMEARFTEQGTMDAYRNLMAQTLREMEARKAAGPLDLIVWPEGSLPWMADAAPPDAVPGESPLPDLLGIVPPSSAHTFILGCDSRSGVDESAAPPPDGFWPVYNCMGFLRADADTRLHAKVRIVAFGEYLPLRKELPFLESWLGHLIPFNFSRGSALEPIRPVPSGPSVIPLICFEDTFGDHARRFIRDEPQLIVNVTNDNWFAESVGAEMHLLNARWRAVELDRAMVRSSNTGGTCVVDADGRVLESLPFFKSGALYARVTLTAGGITRYARYGDAFSQAALVAGGLLGLVLTLRARRRTVAA